MVGIVREMKSTNYNSLVFIDDSGDAGIKQYSSSHLVLAAVLFEDTLTAEQVARSLLELKISIGWTENHEFKFNKTKKLYIKRALSAIVRYDFSVYAVVVNKSHQMNRNTDIYNHTMRRLLEITPLNNANIKIDGQHGSSYAKRVISQLRKESNLSSTKIRRIRFVDSKKDILVQLADLITSSLYRATQQNKSDRDDYVSIIKNKIKILLEI